ncbi:MAG: cztS [Chloroflexi bacterium]|nr:cztS [Chloroflexota bacterium]
MIDLLRGRAHHLRWQLVTGFTVSVMLLLTLLTVAERILVQRSLTQTIESSLSTTVAAGLNTMPTMSVFSNVPSGSGPMPGPPVQQIGQSTQIFTTKGLVGAVGSLAALDQPAALLDATGTVITSTAVLSHDKSTTQPLAAAVLNTLTNAAKEHIHDHASWTGTVATRDGQYALLARPISAVVIARIDGDSVSKQSVVIGGSAGLTTDQGTVSAGGKFPQDLPVSTSMVVLAHSLAQVEQTVQTVTVISVAGAGVVLALVIVLSLFVVRSALRPLATITSGAERLAKGDYAYRLASPRGSDEVGRLSAAFDDMAAAISDAFTKQRRFVADASHELRTPLTALRGYTDVLLLGVRDDPETADRVLHAMEEDLTRMSRLVNDLLMLARLDGESSLQLSALDLRPLLEAARDEAIMICGGAHAISLEGFDQPLIVIGDHDRLRQVLSNLLGNACGYATPGTPIRIAAARFRKMAAVSIQDTGPGIPPENLARLGERFYRGDSARSRRTGGTGLGIAIAKGIMRAHGGSLEIDSTVGRGTSVTIAIPLAPDVHSSVNADASRHAEPVSR